MNEGTWDLSVFYQDFDDPALRGDIDAIRAAAEGMENLLAQDRPEAVSYTHLDRRAEALCDRLKNTVDEQRLFQITENGIDSYFGFAKMLWIKENEPENWKRISLFLTPNQYVAYHLTGEIAIDRTSAGNLGGIFDYERNDWSDEMLELLGIPRSMLPQRIIDPTDILGRLTAEAAAELRLMPGTPVCAGCIDCLASTLSSGVYTAGHTVAVDVYKRQA